MDAALVGRKVACLFDPFDLTRVHVSYQGRPMGDGVPHRLRRHTHPQAGPEPAEPARPATGIDYLALVEARHAAELARRIDYAAFTAAPDPSADPTSEERS